MKHRSVIAFVIIVAALFAAPQLSHDLRTLKGAVGSRLRGELLQAFLNLPPATDGAAAVTNAAPRPAETLLASCPRAKEATAKTKQSESRASAATRSETRSVESGHEQLAMIVDPTPGDLPPRFQGATELAMIIPPGSGIDPHARAASRSFETDARIEASRKLKMAEEQKRVTYVATGFDGKSFEWQKPSEEALRKLNVTLPGTYEFRLERNGSKTRLLKFRRAVNATRPAAATAPRAPRLPGQVAAFAPSVNTQAWPASE